MGQPRSHDLTVQGVLFDLDGVLVDSKNAVERHWAAFARRQPLKPQTFNVGPQVEAIPPIRYRSQYLHRSPDLQGTGYRTRPH